MPRTPPRNSPRTSREQPVARERRRCRRPRPAFGGGPTSKTLSYDAAGNLPHPWVGDGQDYEYVYDAWHRLVRIEERSSGDIVSEHRYPPYGWGNGFRAGERYDSNEDGRVNSSDKWYWFGYDERWRIVGTFRDSDSSPIRLMKNSLRGEGDPEGPDARSCGAAVFEEYGEPRRRRRWLLGVVRSPNGVLHQPDRERFLHHVAGMGGYGSSSYIDDLVLRDRDANTDWNDDASDGTLEERLYYCQNWRHDVVALVTSGGALRERVRYTAYGIPVGMPQGDCDGDGDVDAADQSILLGAWGTSTAKCDLNLDGTVDATDNAILLGQLGATASFGRLSLSGNRFGYAGYASDPAVHADWHVRHRVLMAELGRWSRRDPMRYRDGPSLYLATGARPVAMTDPAGLFACALCPIELCDISCEAWAVSQLGALPLWNALPDCPCYLELGNDGKPTVPAGWSRDPGTWGAPSPYHCVPWCIRRSVPNPLGAHLCDIGQQCCYDRFGSLQTSADCKSGTPDLASPSFTSPVCSLQHFCEDVCPYHKCLAAGRLDLYLFARPPNNGGGCPPPPISWEPIPGLGIAASLVSGAGH